MEIDMSLLGETRKDLRLENFPKQLSYVLGHCSCSSPHPIPSCKWLYLLTHPPTTLDIKTPDCPNIQTPTSDPLFPLLFFFWDSLFLFIYIFFKNLPIFNWGIIALQYCVGFCHTSTLFPLLKILTGVLLLTFHKTFCPLPPSKLEYVFIGFSCLALSNKDLY